MNEWLGITLAFVVGIIIVSGYFSSYTEARKVNKIYDLFAIQNGFAFTKSNSRTINRLTGIYKGRAVTLTVQMIVHRSGDIVYTEIQMQMDNPQQVELFSGEFVKFQLREKSSKLLSGEPIFDSVYRLDGAPPEVVLMLLRSADVRSAIKHLAPNNVPIFERPHFKLESSIFTIRRYTLFSNVEQLQNFLEEVVGFTGLLEEELAKQIPNQAL